MSKNIKTPSVDFEKSIMTKVKSNEISMKPRWYFVFGSFFMVFGLAGLSIIAVYLTNLIFFLLREHGPMGQWRLQVLLYSVPFWIPLFAAVGIGFGIWMLRAYDFSYKKNFLTIILGFIIAIILTGFILDYIGLNAVWSHQGPMTRFYQQIEGQNATSPRGSGRGPGRLFQGGQ